MKHGMLRWHTPGHLHRNLGDKVAVVYPDGFKIPPKPPAYPGGPPQEQFMVLEMNLYGMPSAGRGWSMHRNKFVEFRFNPGN